MHKILFQFIDRLREFYNTFYHPNNATLTIIGDIVPEETLQLVDKYFSPIPASPSPIPGFHFFLNFNLTIIFK